MEHALPARGGKSTAPGRRRKTGPQNIAQESLAKPRCLRYNTKRRCQTGGGKTMESTKNEKMGEGVEFERIRRITGYLVGTMEQWNNAKQAEERDRVKHI